MNGSIRLRRELDFETKASYMMSLLASDGNGRSAVVSLEVVVLPVDEYAPVFSQSSYTFQIPLDAGAGAIVGDVLAVDADGGVHGIPEYRIEPPSNLVAVDKTSGLITLKAKPDRHRNHTVEQIVVIAASSHLQQTKATVYLEIGDFPIRPANSAISSNIFKIGAVATAALFVLLICLLWLLFVWLSIVETQEIDSPRKQTSSMTSSASSNSGIRNSLLSHREAASTRSQPDSGIDQDTVSVNSSVTEYLISIGVNPNPIQSRSRYRRPDTVDSALNEYIYARVEDVLPPGPVNLSSNVEQLEDLYQYSHSRLSAPSFQPLTEIFDELEEIQREQQGKHRDYVQVEI
ncbi:cadherin domain protein [Cooperia oncophora]